VSTDLNWLPNLAYAVSICLSWGVAVAAVRRREV